MVNGSVFTAAHCRAGRALIGWTQEMLADAAKVNRVTVRRFESEGAVRPVVATALQTALEDQGLLFFGENALRDGDAVAMGVAMSMKGPPVSG